MIDSLRIDILQIRKEQPTNSTTNIVGVIEAYTYLLVLTPYYISLKKAWVVIVDSVDTAIQPEGS